MSNDDKAKRAKEQTGVLGEADLRNSVPTEERLRSGPVAVFECIEPIPCNPCESACPNNAVTLEGGLVTGIPKLDDEKCSGCSLCISKCPGRAIFVLDKSFGNGLCRITLPYELLPNPIVGSEVTALDREGREVAKAKVMKVVSNKFTDATSVVTVELAEEYCMSVRAIKVNE